MADPICEPAGDDAGEPFEAFVEPRGDDVRVVLDEASQMQDMGANGRPRPADEARVEYWQQPQENAPYLDDGR